MALGEGWDILGCNSQQSGLENWKLQQNRLVRHFKGIGHFLPTLLDILKVSSRHLRGVFSLPSPPLASALGILLHINLYTYISEKLLLLFDKNAIQIKFCRTELHWSWCIGSRKKWARVRIWATLTRAWWIYRKEFKEGQWAPKAA